MVLLTDGEGSDQNVHQHSIIWAFAAAYDMPQRHIFTHIIHYKSTINS